MQPLTGSVQVILSDRPVQSFYGYSSLASSSVPPTGFMWIATKYGPMLCSIRRPTDKDFASLPAGVEEILVTPPATPAGGITKP
jgi:hypothetical protein